MPLACCQIFVRTMPISSAKAQRAPHLGMRSNRARKIGSVAIMNKSADAGQPWRTPASEQKAYHSTPQNLKKSWLLRYKAIRPIITCSGKPHTRNTSHMYALAIDGKAAAKSNSNIAARLLALSDSVAPAVSSSITFLNMFLSLMNPRWCFRAQ